MLTLATPANMRAYKDANPPRKIPTDDGETTVYAAPCFAYSPRTSERYSAEPGDYWKLGDDEPLLDHLGMPMVLVTERTAYLDALTGEDVNA